MQPPVEDTKKSAESHACDYMIELFISFAQILLSRISYAFPQVKTREKINPFCMFAKREKGVS